MKKMSVLHLTVSLAISSIMVIVIMLIRKVFKNQLSSKWQYNLWFLLLITLLLPYIPTKLLNFGNIFTGNGNSETVSSNSTIESHGLSYNVNCYHDFLISIYVYDFIMFNIIDILVYYLYKLRLNNYIYSLNSLYDYFLYSSMCETSKNQKIHKPNKK